MFQNWEGTPKNERFYCYVRFIEDTWSTLMCSPAYPELRREMGSEVHRMWIQHLGTNKEYFIPKLVGHILEIYFTEPDLRKYAIPIFFDMMQ